MNITHTPYNKLELLYQDLLKSKRMPEIKTTTNMVPKKIDTAITTALTKSKNILFTYGINSNGGVFFCV